ncbi:MAG: zf-HC2 domain-containing protein [Kiritimatiellae bacterium]|nr:zf-HC2 domain-containing protein [Kiritimatiellia bacterium]
MNCQEIQELVEEAIDNRLSESCTRKVARHLARCASCKALFAAEKSEHAALFRALNDVSDIPPPSLSQADFASRLVASTPSLTKRAGHVAVPLWLKRAAAIAILCGGAALAAWIGATMESRQAGDDMESRHLGGETLPPIPTPIPQPEGEPQVKRTLLAATAIVILTTPPAQGASSAEATFDSFSSEFRTSAAAEASSFLSRSRTTKEAEALSSFNSFEPKGLYFIIK